MEQNQRLYSIFKEQSKIIEMISVGNLPLTDILNELLQTIDLVMPTIKSSIMFFNEKTHTLGNGIGPNLPKEYLDEINGLHIGPRAGSCGTAAFFKKMVIVEDTKIDPLWGAFCEKSDKYELVACWSKPLLSPTNNVLGTLAFYSNEKRKPTPKELELIDTFSNLAGLIVVKKRTEDRLYLSNTVVENSPVILMRWKAEEGWPLEYVTENVSQLGYNSKDFMTGKINFSDIVYPDDLKRITEEMNYYSKQAIEQFTQEYRILTRDGSVRWIDDRTIIQRNEKGVITHYQGTILDITDRKEAEAKIKFLADNDTLTQLPNRRVFMEQLRIKLEKAKSKESLVAVLFLDLDNFKDVNDLMGHHFGDQLLINVAEKLKKYLPKDCFISRVSGDEFAFILTAISNETVVVEISLHLLKLFHVPFIVEDNEIQITASMGISFYPTHGEHPETLLKQADLAMYSAKRDGKNTFQFYTNELSEQRLLKKQLQMELEAAITANQFILYYQPQIDIHTWEITGVEALIRWNHPKRGILSPIEFVPLAEETGLITAIDEWVLREACYQTAAWKKMGLSSVSVSINLSDRQFYNKNLVYDVARILKEANLTPQDLTLEMTEGTLMTDKENTIKILDNLKELGVHTSLDDFGTGYSSLSYLKYFPISKLKIDRSFITDITTNERDLAIVETIFTLANHLNLEVIVEGVETKEQLDFLKEKTCCKVAQGFFFSRPLTPEDIVGFFEIKVEK